MRMDVVLVFLGDVMTGRNFNLPKRKSSNSKRSVWGNVLPSLLDADVRIANLEGVFTARKPVGQTSPYIHQMDPANVEWLLQAKINCCTIANNHILDCGLPAVKESVDLLKKNGIRWCGFGNSETCWRPSLLTVNTQNRRMDTSPCLVKRGDITGTVSEKGLGLGAESGKLDHWSHVTNLATDKTADTPGLHSHLAKMEIESPNKYSGGKNSTCSADMAYTAPLQIAVFALADHYREWAAEGKKPGINYFDIRNFTHDGGNPNRSMWTSMATIKDKICTVKDKVDVVIVSLHWGNNFGWSPSPKFQEFAHALVDEGVDIVYGHSAHHIQGVEVYRGKFILYSCGDCLDDYDVYEQHSGESLGAEFKSYRSDLGFIYKLHWSAQGSSSPYQKVLNSEEQRCPKGYGSHLELIPIKISECQVNMAPIPDAIWLKNKMEELCEEFGTSVTQTNDTFVLRINNDKHEGS